MPILEFDVQAFQSQQLPDPLPVAADPVISAPVPSPVPADELPDLLGTQSMFLGLLDTAEKVAEHWALVAQAKAQQAAMQPTRPESDIVVKTNKEPTELDRANLAWRECVRKRDQAKLDWKKRLADIQRQRDVELASLELEVNDARTIFQNLRLKGQNIN